MTSGVRLILKDLEFAVSHNVPVRILTGRYLNITQPEALALLKGTFGEKIDLRFCLTEPYQSFHPKAYFFHKQNGSDLFIGSSNISKSALTSGIEWNYRFNSNQHKEDFDYFFQTFEDLFLNHSVKIDDEELKEYSKAYHKPQILKSIEETENQNNGENQNIIPFEYEPRGAQIEALYALEQTRKEGATKALIHAATGIGKTYLAAFDSKNYRRVLFVAHREEILKQAAESFYNVRHSDDFGFFYSGMHEKNKSVIFASVQSLGKNEYLREEFFPKDYFDYIVIDEFHHAAANQYLSIINYFNPKFLLGLTATPERADGRNIYELCDYNIPFEISLFQGINRGLLVPFHYYGIYDETDYSSMRYAKGDYLEEDLNNAYIGNENRSHLILNHFKKYSPKKSLGFCASRLHAKYMAEFFCKNGIPSVAVYSGEQGDFSEERDKAIRLLNDGKIKIIFSVNMFNEGVDIPSVEAVLFLRPTQSEVIFLQQLGRGLRLYKNKEFLTVLDFIGNYKNAGKFIKNLKERKNPDGKPFSNIEEENYIFPDGCLVDFEFELIDLFERLKQKSQSVQSIIKNEFYRIKDLLGKIPSRTEFFENIDWEIYQLCLKNVKFSPFKNYLQFLKTENLLGEDEKIMAVTIAADFLNEVERTSMTKSYKMPVLLSFYKDGKILQKVNENDLLESWKKFYSNNLYWKDLPQILNFESYKKITDKEHLANIKKNPVHYLILSGKGYFSMKENYFTINERLLPFLENPAFATHFKDIIDYRTADYFSRRYNEANEAHYEIPEEKVLMVADSGAKE